ncbi:MAG: hypothetical protein IT379_06655 [Deltaproteobacteria bacterium]|nr:hypothetical protein [Deltaproteobacteria bacterium]
MRRTSWFLFTAVVSMASGCDGGGLPDVWRATPAGDGPRVRWDLEAEPIAEIPLPNDIATWPDPTTATGRRLNPSQIVETSMEGMTRQHVAQLDGWSTYGAITIPFDGLIDLREIHRRQGGREAFSVARFREHAVYLVDLETGHPIPLDVNTGMFPYVLPALGRFFEHDPRADESNVLFETVAEDVDGDGVLDPGEDTDFDGVLDVPNTFDGRVGTAPNWDVDEMTWFYERETNSLYLRPILPMMPARTYAVVVTDRLVGEGGAPVRSPFDAVHHYAQEESLESLPRHFAEHPDVYGDLATRGWSGVAFAWSFTTQSTTRDFDALRDGLYGRGALASLAESFPPVAAPITMQGAVRGECDRDANVFIAPGDRFRTALATVLSTALGIGDPDAQEKVLTAYEALDHVAVMFFETPMLLGDPDAPSLYDTWDIDAHNGRATVGREVISAVVLVPKETAEHRQPFPSLFYVHGHGSANGESLPFGGFLLQHGIAAVLLNANGHGVDASPLITSALRGIFGTECLAPSGDAILAGRARDLDGEDGLDSGASFWTAYVFHTRDQVRQTVLDHVRAVQILRSFDGRPWPSGSFVHRMIDDPITFAGDIDADGAIEAFGDFDANGTPDLGGPAGSYAFTGGSLGGIMTGVMAGVEPAVNVAVPIVGGGGLTDVAVRTENGSVRKTMHLRLMSPFVYTEASAGPSDRTTCAQGDVSLRVRATFFDDDPEYELACVPGDLLDDDDALVVRNLRNGLVRCAGSTAGEPARYRVPIGSNENDPWVIEIHRDAAMRADWGDCTFDGGSTPARVIDTFEVGSEDCERCARFGPHAWAAGDPLVSPADGLGYRRQSPDVRRALFFSQLALDSADPINYARRVFLDPVRDPTVPDRPRSVLVANSAGDLNVCLNAGHAYARAAGVLPFLPPDAPEELREWRAPGSFLGRYEGLSSPNDVLLAYHVTEGTARLRRHPTGEVEDFLVDVEDLSDGRMRFQPDGAHQQPDGLAPVVLDPPLRWVRSSRHHTGAGDDPFDVRPGEPLSGMLTYYVIPDGIHGFDEIIYPSDATFDTSQYIINLIGRYAASQGRDLRYHTDPGGHRCLEDSSCDFFAPYRGASR